MAAIFHIALSGAGGRSFPQRPPVNDPAAFRAGVPCPDVRKGRLSAPVRASRWPGLPPVCWNPLRRMATARERRRDENRTKEAIAVGDVPAYLRDVPPGAQTYGTLSYNRRSKCWTIKGEPCVTELAKRLFPGCDGRGRGGKLRPPAPLRAMWKIAAIRAAEGAAENCSRPCR